MEWSRIQAELQGKIRWAIATTVGENQVCNLPYQDGKDWGGKHANHIVEDLKAMIEKPGYKPWLTSS
tara:strand:- start:556 stop:756 length:201 start_codon:yes stop_codon:yes gene_type:complete